MKDIFKDDVSLSRIKAVLTSLAKAGEINLCVLDVLGNPIIYPTNDCALCKCVRESAHGRAQCIKYASHSVLEAMREKRTYFYVCPFGLVDFVTPIFYDGEFLGAVCGGQVRSTEAAARADFVYPFFGRNEYGVDEKRMRELFEAMPDRPAERFFESAKLVELFAGNLGSVTAGWRCRAGRRRRTSRKGSGCAPRFRTLKRISQRISPSEIWLSFAT